MYFCILKASKSWFISSLNFFLLRKKTKLFCEQMLFLVAKLKLSVMVTFLLQIKN